jgi:hypothetical protein
MAPSKRIDPARHGLVTAFAAIRRCRSARTGDATSRALQAAVALALGEHPPRDPPLSGSRGRLVKVWVLERGDRALRGAVHRPRETDIERMLVSVA